MTRDYKPGMTLNPGEGFELDAGAILPPDVAELVRRGQLKLETRQGPQVEYAPGKYRIEVLILLDGRPFGTFGVSYEFPSRWQLFKLWLKKLKADS